MHITCRRRDLYRALRLLSRAVPTRSTLPILQNVLVEAPGTLVVDWSLRGVRESSPSEPTPES